MGRETRKSKRRQRVIGTMPERYRRGAGLPRQSIGEVRRKTHQRYISGRSLDMVVGLI